MKQSTCYARIACIGRIWEGTSGLLPLLYDRTDWTPETPPATHNKLLERGGGDQGTGSRLKLDPDSR